MMFDRLLAWFHRWHESKHPSPVNVECDDYDEVRRRLEVERRIQEARRMNDTFDDIVQAIQRDQKS